MTCSVYVAVCRSVHVAVCWRALQVSMRGSALQCVTVCCSVLHCVSPFTHESLSLMHSTLSLYAHILVFSSPPKCLSNSNLTNTFFLEYTNFSSSLFLFFTFFFTPSSVELRGPAIIRGRVVPNRAVSRHSEFRAILHYHIFWYPTNMHVG